MPDKYSNFADLARMEVGNFSFRHKNQRGANAIIAPHGGGIEPGTSELAEAISRDDFSLYTFDGNKISDNGDLHLTSTRFDEPECLVLLAQSPTCIAVHGEGSAKEVVFLGGLDHVTGDRIRVSLESRGFKVDIHENPRLQGTDPANICNRGTTGCGVQLELSEGLRRTFFEMLTPRKGREVKTERFFQFVAALREAILESQ